MSEGADGNIYMILIGNVLPLACNDRLFGVNPKTGAVVVDAQIGLATTSNYGLRYAQPVAWTLDDAIIVVNRNGVIREFSYLGVEDTSATYQLASSGNYVIDQLVADDEGTVFAKAFDGNSTSPTLAYHKRDGTNGAILDQDATTLPMAIEPTSNGSIIGVPYTGGTPRLDYFNLATNAVVSSNPAPLTSGYSGNSITGYSEDAAGNSLTMWNQWNSNEKAISIDLYNSSTNTASTVFLKKMQSADLANYPDFEVMSQAPLRNSVVDGSLYLLICEDSPSNCYSSGSGPDILLHKIDVGMFGTALGKGFKRNSYERDKLEYVAMGDSYSSGEGNPEFNSWTESSTNKCHRSDLYAFPHLLENDENLNLDLGDFVACSGATTDNVLNGGSSEGSWGEPAQINALSSGTDIVTLTVGGNDVGFKSYVTACFLLECSVVSPAYDNIVAEINSAAFHSKLVNTYKKVLEEASTAEVYVLNYPHAIKDNDFDACFIIDHTVVGQSDDAAETVTTLLNVAIADAYLEIKQNTEFSSISDRLHYVETSSYFAGLDLCADSAAGFYDFERPVEFSMHPNHIGHDAFYRAIKDQL